MHVDQEVALEDEFALFISLCGFVCLVLRTYGISVRTKSRRHGSKRLAHVFPAEDCLTLAAVDITDGVVACGHLAVVRFTFNHIHTAAGPGVKKRLD